MRKNNIFLTLALFIVITGCAPHLNQLYFAKDEPSEDFGYPTEKEIEKSFYLLGDGGYSPPGGSSEALLAFKTYIDSVKQVGNYTIFLGDNVYPAGLVSEDHPERELMEYRLDAQIDAVENYDGNLFFVPGNHDWYAQGLTGLERQADYLREKLERDDVFLPEAGCGLTSIEVTDSIQLLVADSQWFLEDWDEHPKINDDCDEIKTREAFFQEIDSELKKNQTKTVVFAIHHPLYTNGLHGGNFSLTDHLYPTQRKLPLPILGTLANFIRTTGGVTSTDLQNERYKGMRKRIETIASRWGNVVFVSGHDHSVQYIEHDEIKQIVSGSASKASYVGLGSDGLFAYSGQGFATLDIFKDGSSWVSMYGSENKKPKLLYQKEVIAAPQPFNTDTLSTSFPQRVRASVYEPADTLVSTTYESIWGDRYRDLYGTPVEVPVAILDTLYGGLTVERAGGGHQTRSLRLKDSQGRDYNLRALEKSAVQFIQTVAYKDTPVETKFENTLAEDVIRDFYTSAHPYAFLAIPKLSEAAGIFHTNPQVFYVPKQKALGDFNSEYGDELYMIVERPEEGWVGYESFGSPNHDIESTSGVFERLRRDEKYSLDEAAYIRARIFDMLVGDWDRHEDQWRWAEIEDEAGNHLFKPIPRDRDQVFSNFDGAFFNTLRGLTGFANQFAVYDEDISNIEWFNSAAVGLDRSLIQNSSKEEWLRQARYLQEQITDEVIEEAFAELPEETRGEATQRIIRNLKARRNNIVDIAERYYNYFAKFAMITATDKDDHIEIERLPEGKTRVSVYRIKDGEKADVVSNREYDPAVTGELWVYGLDDDDIFEVFGEAPAKILVRIIGGQNNDIYRIKNGKKVKVYDHESLPNTVEVNDGADITFTDNYEVNVFDKDRKIYTSSSILPAVGYNPDDGFQVGVSTSFTKYGFRRNPFTAQHRFRAGYYFATESFDLRYRGEFANIFGDYNFLLKAHFTNPSYTRNFFGMGNETKNYEEELGKDFNRVRISRIGGDAGIVKNTPFGRFYQLTASFEGVQIEETSGRFLSGEYMKETNFFDRQYFAGLEGLFRYESYDDVLNPTNGMKFEFVGGGKINTGETDNLYGFVRPYLEFYKAVTRNDKWVINSRVNAEVLWEDDFEFYQAATLGGAESLRGFREERFSGESAFVWGNDLRYSFDEFKTSFVPFQIGVFAGYDVGRVWLDGEDSNLWHDSYGGGLWITGAEAVSAKLNLFSGGEKLRFSFSLGVSF
ncbi:metallophosphoesterase [Salinimicrobium tongyeongense]|uniref:Metallophosphoesterase n=1 Tax=Salinimicrobium tongyeongense TaxID=2809707 RepID=A0ABY6NRL5_9FLAO|nr:ShlB/FhaC/HecB family hemolysin secretion/activation protein [Salinimicrobium tongyeongense]UZH55549.1 metallophosphoesterase [Salinimicrobium tongyeongense]